MCKANQEKRKEIRKKRKANQERRKGTVEKGIS